MNSFAWHESNAKYNAPPSVACSVCLTRKVRVHDAGFRHWYYRSIHSHVTESQVFALVKYTMSGINTLDQLAIRNVLSRYCEALDLKDFNLLEKVFLHDVVADYPFNSDLNGVNAVSKAIQNRYV
jgi:hypothetical protein